MIRIRRTLDVSGSCSLALASSRLVGLGAMTLLLSFTGFANQRAPSAPAIAVEAHDEKPIAMDTFRRAVAELDRRVAAREMTREHADKLVAVMRTRVVTDAPRERAGVTREDYTHAEAELDELVEAGKLTRNQVVERLRVIRRMIAAGSRAGTRGELTRENLKGVALRLRIAVAEGRLSREDARKRLGGFLRSTADEPSGESITREEYGAMSKRFDRMVAAEMMSRGDADERLSAMRRILVGSRERMRVALTPTEPDAVALRLRRGNGNREAEKAITREEYGAIAAKLEKMVAAGKLTREEANLKLEALRKRIPSARTDQRKAR